MTTMKLNSRLKNIVEIIVAQLPRQDQMQYRERITDDANEELRLRRRSEDFRHTTPLVRIIGGVTSERSAASDDVQATSIIQLE